MKGQFTTRFAALTVALLLLAPVAIAVLQQAALVVA